MLRSSAFARDLTELSEYGARIKQERPILLLCAKHLWRAGHDVIVEGGHDLRVDGVTFQFKQHYDWDIPKAFKEPRRWPPRRSKSESRLVLPGIHRDIINKRPDVFVWIISERDLDGIGEWCKDHVVYCKEQLRHKKQGWTTAQTRRKANVALNRTAARRGSRQCVSVETRARFVSTYHFLIRSFRGGRNPRGP
jgi:hypothetical protein